MMTALKKQKSPYESSASVVDGKLILSFPNARTPVVWQMDLMEVKASAMEVKGEKDPFTLILRTTKGDALEVAPFATKEEAVEALVAITRALQSAHGLIRPAGVSEAPAKIQPVSGGAFASGGKPRWGRLALAVLILAGVLYLFLTMQRVIPNVPPDASGGIMADMSRSGQPQNGVPMSADEFLNTNR